MKPKNHKALVLAALKKHPLLDDGGPVMISIPTNDAPKTKLETKACELRRRPRRWCPDTFDARPTLLHLVKLGLVERERSGIGRSNRTYFKLVKKEVTTAELYQQAAENLHTFVQSLPRGSLATLCCDLAALNKGLLAYSSALAKEDTDET